MWRLWQVGAEVEEVSRALRHLVLAEAGRMPQQFVVGMRRVLDLEKVAAVDRTE